MAVLAKHPEGTRSIVLSPHLVGRSRLANLRMAEPTVSGEHAVLRWIGREWELHDLGSRNGTIVDGRRLAPGERTVLGRGSRIAFGQPDNVWELVDESAPTAVAIASTGDEVGARNHLLALPGEDNPEVVVYRNAAGDWVTERAGETTRVKDGVSLQVGELSYVLRLPDLFTATWDNAAPAPALAGMTLRFAVSSDEEYVALSARSSTGTIDLGSRAHHAVLLTLARSRLEDRATRGGGNGLPESAEGWVYQDELAEKLAIDETHLNVAVFRCRRQLAEAGIIDAANIIERRRPTREVRLGVSRIEIVKV